MGLFIFCIIEGDRVHTLFEPDGVFCRPLMVFWINRVSRKKIKAFPLATDFFTLSCIVQDVSGLHLILPRVNPMGSMVIALVSPLVRGSVGPSLNISETAH